MSVYRGQFARLYDLFYADKAYDEEVSVLDRVLRHHSVGEATRLLDVACGTGQHAVRFADHGWDVLGVDQSEEMLARARERAGQRGVTFVRQDMVALELDAPRFDAAVCLFDSIGYAVTNEGVLATLRAIRRHVRPDGLLAVEFWHAAAMLSGHDAVRVRDWSTETGTVIRISRTTLDVARQTASVEYTVHEFTTDGGYVASHEAHRNRYFLVQEMSLLLSVAGFAPVQWLAGYEEGHPIDGSTWHVVAIARATSGSPA